MVGRLKTPVSQAGVLHPGWNVRPRGQSHPTRGIHSTPTRPPVLGWRGCLAASGTRQAEGTGAPRPPTPVRRYPPTARSPASTVTVPQDHRAFAGVGEHSCINVRCFRINIFVYHGGMKRYLNVTEVAERTGLALNTVKSPARTRPPDTQSRRPRGPRQGMDRRRSTNGRASGDRWRDIPGYEGRPGAALSS